ncbi:MAG: DinB family protein [Bacteroidetes bacterium]|nr:DinB family protein [Bacteroidota bacterium]
MISNKSYTDTLFAELSATQQELVNLLNNFSATAINQVPFEGSWTAAQVADHVTLSNFSIARALQLKGNTINREPDERAGELKDLFLDFNRKFKSPDFIVPTKNEYDKTELIYQLHSSIDKIQEAADTAVLTELITHPAFGDITKLEILHFVLYHTQRHLQQVKNIQQKISEK